MRISALAIIALLGLSACATAPRESDDIFETMFSGVNPAQAQQVAARLAQHPLGSAENPVRADMPPGQRAYLARLRCADGRGPAFQRIGSFGVGPYGMIIDGYDVVCAGSTPAQSVIYIDMYHRGHVETTAVPGFTIVAP